MDLATLDTAANAEEGVVMQVRHPISNAPLEDASGTAITITLAGEDSPRFQKAQRTVQNRRLAVRGRRTNTLTAEQLEEDALETLSAATIAWSGIVVDGETLPCSPANARRAYKRLPWLREQVDAFVGDRANFLPTSPTN